MTMMMMMTMMSQVLWSIRKKVATDWTGTVSPVLKVKGDDGDHDINISVKFFWAIASFQSLFHIWWLQQHWRVFQEPLLFPLETTVNNGYSCSIIFFSRFSTKVTNHRRKRVKNTTHQKLQISVNNGHPCSMISYSRVTTNYPGWQKLCEGTKGLRRKVWTQTKILSPNICYFVAIYALFGRFWANKKCSLG